MKFEKALHDLLEQPFGPYLEGTILSDKCRFMASKRLLLDDFQLVFNNKPTGFDQTEFDGPLTPSSVIHLGPIPSSSRVLFRGVLSLLTSTHLSEEGLKYINDDFKERLTRSAVNGVLAFKRHTGRSLDLEKVFTLRGRQKDVPEAERYNVRVLIQGCMHSTASFLRSDLAPNGLLFHAANASKTKFRIYQIVSMDIETYKLSRTFLFRHHTLRTMRDILDRSASDGVPAHKCTPQWFLEQYFIHHAYPSHSRWQRINFLEGAESSDEGFSTHPEHPPDAQTYTPRHLRKVHKNEIWSIFASHSEWILSLVEKHKDLKTKVNTQSWKIFLIQVPQLRQRALFSQDTDGKWGFKDEQEGAQMAKVPSNILPSSPPVSKEVKSQPADQKGKKTKPYIKSSSIISVMTDIKTDTITASSSKTPVTSRAQAEDQFQNIYDSDFTQGSPSPTTCHASSWHDPSTAVHHPSLPDPSLYALIPHEMLTSPTLPLNMLWHCPIGGGTCSYVIDLCAPSDANLKAINTVIPQNEVIHFLEKGWKSNDEKVHLIFYEMVNAHWEGHLKELNIKHVCQGDASTFQWIHPQKHAPWPPKEWKLMRAREQHLESQKQQSPAF